MDDWLSCGGLVMRRLSEPSLLAVRGVDAVFVVAVTGAGIKEGDPAPLDARVGS